MAVEGLQINLKAFLTSAIRGGELSASRSGQFNFQDKATRYMFARRSTVRLLLVPSLVYSSTLKREDLHSSEPSVKFHTVLHP
jgi:hypothetical protein